MFGNPGDCRVYRNYILPNITGSINANGSTSFQGYFVNPSGALTLSGSGRGTFNAPYSSSGFYCGFEFDASRSSSVYQSITEVRPTNYSINYFIKY